VALSTLVEGDGCSVAGGSTACRKDLNDRGLVSPEVWRLICNLWGEYEAELLAMRERPFS
jgi:hypothetical protein